MWRRDMTYIYAILGLIGVVAILCSTLQSPTSVWRSILLELGTAVLIAAVLGVSIDRISSQGFQKEIDTALGKIKLSVFEETLRRTLPTSVVSEVLHNIFNQMLIREDYRIIVALHQDPRLPPSQLRSAVTISYRLRNFGGQAVMEVIRGSVTLAPQPPEGWVVYERVRVERLNGQVIELAGSELQERSSQESLVARYEVPITLQKDECVDVKTTQNMVVHSRDHLVIAMATLTENLEVTVRPPDDFEVIADLLHPAAKSKSRQDQDRIDKLDAEGVSTWRIHGGILPFQGVELIWRPRHAEAGDTDEIR